MLLGSGAQDVGLDSTTSNFLYRSKLFISSCFDFRVSIRSSKTFVSLLLTEAWKIERRPRKTDAKLKIILVYCKESLKLLKSVSGYIAGPYVKIILGIITPTINTSKIIPKILQDITFFKVPSKNNTPSICFLSLISIFLYKAKRAFPKRQRPCMILP